jgi:transposase
MPRTTNPYTAEFSEKIAALAHSGRSVEDLAKEFEPCLATIHGWIKPSLRRPPPSPARPT